LEPFYINAPSGNIFALYHRPGDGADITRNILFIPPFGEELNRSRHVINHQARSFAKAGYAVLILDLYGTGDSTGTFGEATVDIWQKDIIAAINWLKQTSNAPPIPWAMRSGALLTADLVQQYPDITDQMILWSPVQNGKKFIAQYMRIKLAAEMTGRSEKKASSMKDLWASLEGGENLEIAGYTVSPKLAKGFAGLSLAAIKIPQTISVKWLEISSASPARLSPVSQNIINIWKNHGTDVTEAAVNDVLFWTLQEPEWANHYCDKTLNLLEKENA